MIQPVQKSQGKAPKISVITVCFNSEATIGHTIDSVNSQIYPHVEHVFVDGASSDNTIKIIQEHSIRNKLVVSDADDGIYDAMNKGIALASGNIVGFLNSDDFYADEAVLSKVAEVFDQNPSVDGCFADLVYTDQMDAARTARYWQSNHFVPGAFSKGWMPPHPTFFVRRSVYECFGGFDLTYHIAADVELMMRFLEVRKIRVRYVPEVWVRMRLGGTTNKSLKNIWVQNQEVLRGLRSHGLPANLIRLFGHKLLSRGKQFFRKPSL